MPIGKSLESSFDFNKKLYFSLKILFNLHFFMYICRKNNIHCSMVAVVIRISAIVP